MRNISRFIEEKLGLKVNMTKSKVDRPSGLKYLGFGFYFDSQEHISLRQNHMHGVDNQVMRCGYPIIRSGYYDLNQVEKSGNEPGGKTGAKAELTKVYVYFV
jgi:hypothetical protein